jgi:predicted glycoside hydrolase/deacetylase ChbG (UPF0249 family)
VSTQDPQTGLVDEQGYLHRSPAVTQAQADPQAAARELEAQIQRALAAGMAPTHADTHIGTVAHPRFIQSYIDVAIRHRVPPMVLRLDEEGWRRLGAEHSGTALGEEGIARAVQMVQSLEEMGVPLLDHIKTLWLEADPDTRFEQAKQVLDTLKPGITHFFVHPASDTPELRAITGHWAARVADYQTFMMPALRDHIRDIGVQVIGYRAIQAVMGA